MTHVIRKTALVIVVAGWAAACAPSTETRAPSESDPSASPTREESPPAAIEPGPREAAAEEPVADDPVVAVPVVEGRWRPALPEVSNEAPDEARLQRGLECVDPETMAEAKVSPSALMSAAVCLRQAGLYGQEVTLYRGIIAQPPEEPLTMDALRTLGLRLEQLDHRSGALDAWESYLKRYPKQSDARAVGMRSVCLARTLGDPRREGRMLDALQRNYGNKGFVRPKPEQLPALCGETEGE